MPASTALPAKALPLLPWQAAQDAASVRTCKPDAEKAISSLALPETGNPNEDIRVKLKVTLSNKFFETNVLLVI